MERRTEPRHELWLPVHLEEHEPAVAITHNASRNGLLIVTARKVSEGPIGVRFHWPTGETAGRVTGRVLRSEVNADDPNGLWPFAIAVEFESPLPDIEALYSAFTAQG
ncbi:MAG TPA: PilZ domain-containing protein [Polyangiaceae bacterium]